MERSQLAGILVTAFLVLSSLIYLIGSPSSRYVAPGTYSGVTVGKLVRYVDKEWVIPTTGVDLNGFPVLQTGNGFAFVDAGDKNRLISLLRERNVPFFLRDAIVRAPVNLGGKQVDMNIYSFVQPDLTPGSLVRINYQVTVARDGTVQALGQEAGAPASP